SPDDAVHEELRAGLAIQNSVQSGYDSGYSGGKPMTLPRRRLPGILFVCILTGSLTLASQAKTQSVTDGVYSAEQATRGQALYRAQCSRCHGGTLGGQTGPPLTGDYFNAKWSSQTLLDLANK